jgi:uncharacterized membrane protein YesL
VNITTPAAGDTGSTMSALLFVAQLLSWVLFILFLFMRHYLYLMVVTFDLKIRQILKNGVIFALAGLPRNIRSVVIELLICVILLAIPGVMGGLLELLLLGLFLLSLGGFASVFITFPVIKRFMIKEAELTAAQEDEAQ